MATPLRYYVSVDAPGDTWAVKVVLLTEQGNQMVGEYPSYYPTKREAKIEANRRNAELAQIISSRATRAGL